MKQLIKLLLIAFLIPLQAHAADKNTVTAEILDLSGLKQHAQDIAVFASGEIDNRKEGLPEEEYKRLHDLVQQAFNEKRIYDIIQKYFLSHYNAKLSPQWLQTLKSPEMISINNLESESANPDNFKHIIAYAQHLQANPPSKIRVDLVKRLDTATRASNLALESQVSVTKILLHAINPSLTSNKQMSTTQLQSALDALRMQTEHNLQQFTTITNLYTYRSLSDEALTQYINHYESPEGQWAANTTYNAIIEALKDAMQH